MNVLFEDPSLQTWVKLEKLQRQVQAAIHDALREQELPPALWFEVLSELRKRSEAQLRPQQLQQLLQITQPNMSRLLERMTAEGLVKRGVCDDDGRGHYIELTTKGRQVQRLMWAVVSTVARDQLGKTLSAEQLGQLQRILGKAIAQAPGQ
jgi:DNA-binding MarR family transcriptional regulator